jgi:hypothetical protein
MSTLPREDGEVFIRDTIHMHHRQVQKLRIFNQKREFQYITQNTVQAGNNNHLFFTEQQITHPCFSHHTEKHNIGALKDKRQHRT